MRRQLLAVLRRLLLARRQCFLVVLRRPLLVRHQCCSDLPDLGLALRLELLVLLAGRVLVLAQFLRLLDLACLARPAPDRLLRGLDCLLESPSYDRL